MSHPATLLPPRRPELVIGPLGERGDTVVKDPLGGGYYHLGAAEAFLLRLDGRQTADAARGGPKEPPFDRTQNQRSYRRRRS